MAEVLEVVASAVGAAVVVDLVEVLAGVATLAAEAPEAAGNTTGLTAEELWSRR